MALKGLHPYGKLPCMTTQPAEADRQFSYEIGYLVDSTLSPESAEKVAVTLKSLIEKAGGSITQEGQPVLRQLAYEIVKGTVGKKHKHKAGYFGWVQFKADASEIPGLTAKLNGQEEIIRFLLIKKDRETVLMTPQELKEEQAEGERAADGTEPAEGANAEGEEKSDKPISKEDIDQKIDNLVIA